jgi:hypothetical protein
MSSYRTSLYDSEDGGTKRRPKSVSWDKDEPHVLEYELVTPDPSVVGSPSAEYDSDDYEDEDDLENTPVIEPDGWRLPEPDNPHDVEEYRSTPSPNGRPLPPIPGVARSDSASPSGARPLPTLPLTKAELQNQATMSIEERMRRMMEGNDPTRRLSWDPNNRRRSRQGPEFQDGLGIMLNKSGMEYSDDEHMKATISPEDMTSDRDESSPNSNREPDGESIISSQYESASDYEPPRISRESIRRQVEERRNQQAQDSETDGDHHEMVRGGYYSSDSGLEDEMYLKHGSSDDGVDICAPELQKVHQRPASRFATRAPDPDQVTESEASLYDDQDEGSQYSERREEEEEEEQHTPRPESSFPDSPASTATALPDGNLEKDLAEMRLDDEARVSLPDFSSLVDGGLGLTQYMTPPHPAAQEAAPVDAPSANAPKEPFAQEDTSPTDEVSDEYSDTGSVIRHKIEYSDDEEDENYEDESDFDDHGEEMTQEQAATSRSPSPVAESIATIRAPGGKLKTRASATPADMAAMAAARRQVSGEQHNPLPAARMPNGYRSEGESGTEDTSDGEDAEESAVGQSDTEAVNRRVSGTRRRKISTTLPALGEFEFDLKLDDLNDEFDRVIEKQKVNSLVIFFHGGKSGLMQYSVDI